MREDYEGYDPDGPGLDNGNFLGLPQVASPAVRFIAVPFDATVSYGAGTAGGPANVLAASRQLDVCVPGLAAPWRAGFAWETLDCASLHQATSLRAVGRRAIEAAERGEQPAPSDLEALEAAAEDIAACLRRRTAASLLRSEFPVVVGGEHSVALGAYGACADVGAYGILQIDAHMDLRERYEGLVYSHASVMHNALEEANLVRIVQVGIRDYSPGEWRRARACGARVATVLDDDLQRAKLTGQPFAELAAQIVGELPDAVWVSLDVDGLDPSLCAHTGTPVPGGLSFAEADFLLAALAGSGNPGLARAAGPACRQRGDHASARGSVLCQPQQ